MTRDTVSPVMAVTAPSRTRAALLRLLERDERLFAVLLAFVMVGGLGGGGGGGRRRRPRGAVYSPVCG